MSKGSQIEIYQAKDGSTQIKVQFEDDTVWLTQAQMAELFETTPQNITMHLKSIFKELELDEKSTCKDFLQVRKEGARLVKRKQLHYNLDAIISVGYRVKSTRATQFRIWANSVLKQYLVKGYAINQKRLTQKEEEIQILKNGISILGRVIEEKTAQTDNAWIQHFAKGLSLLDDYDHENLDKKGLTTRPAHYPTLQEYQQLVNQMRSEFDSDVFGKEKDHNFQSSIAQITKGFGETDFYPSLEEKAATLLYLVTKNHSFVDGNKRIAAACFLKFLDANNMLINQKQTSIIGNDTLASLTLFIASSKPEEMETVKQLVVSVLNRNK
ncbi:MULTISPECIES: virulence protein RhuM/Fic/DOC family protein [unclassified Allomuricauda]|uniref:virulence protein RhuM/Fic/DOC family protein n=1 Tax=unclassified Allomuricauda TaxID=2615049 RepID=UPI00273DBC9C|nr:MULTISPECIES: virulence protein RhuM/Fic/DOC family protein [unclassified Allomuricauda]